MSMIQDTNIKDAARVLLIQLSDMHFMEKGDAVLNRSEQIAGAVQNLLPLSTQIILIVTGDIAQSGKKAEYDLANKFINDIACNIRSRYNIDIAILTVPGNHDAEFNSAADVTRTQILERLKSDSSDVINQVDVEECVKVFGAYEEFAKGIETETAIKHSPIWRTFTLDVGSNSLQVHCVNTAWSCALNTEPGSLGFPLGILPKCADANGALRILLMHHPAHWIAAHQYREFRRAVRQCAEICFTGHEHESNAGSNHDSETGRTLFVEGSVLQDRGDPNVSGFNASLIDFNDNTLQTTEFALYEEGYRCVAPPFCQTITPPSNSAILSTKWTEFLSDLGSNLTHPTKAHLNLTDIYVYPELEQQSEEETPIIISSQQLSREIASDSSSRLIKGDQSSGKTALLKCMFVDALKSGVYPIYINGEKLKIASQKDLQSLIERAVREQYAEESVDKVLQSEPRKRVLLLDNLDRYKFPDRFMSSVLEHFEKQFLKIIATADSAFDLKEALLDKELNSLRAFVQLRLLEFGFKLRFALVSKWFFLDEENQQPTQNAQLADRIISRVVGRGLVPSLPIYVLILLQSIEIGRQGELENSALGHYYQYMILQAFETNVRQDQIDEVLNYCSQFAWFLHSKEKLFVSDVALREFHSNFEKEFDLEIIFEERKRVLLKTDLFFEDNNALGFRYPYGYFFFLGRYLSRNLKNIKTITYIEDCCENLHVRAHGNAMLFLAHHSNDQYVFDALQKAVNSRFANIAPLHFEQDTEALDKMVEQAPIIVFNQSKCDDFRERVQTEDQRIERTIDEVANGELNDQDETLEKQQVINLLSDVNGLIKGIELLGMALKSNAGSLNADSKRKMIQTMFDGGLRGLRVFVEAFIDLPDYMIAELGAALRDMESTSPTDRERAVKIRIFQFISRFSFWFIQRVGSSVGSKSMEPAIRHYVDENDKVSNKLIYMTSTLETPNRIPREYLKALNARVAKNAFPQSILRMIVLHRMYMYKTTETEKQQVAEEMKIGVSTQHAIDLATRKSKRLPRL
jgi:hypothetical protein